MTDIFIVTSVIHTGAAAWSYTATRSIFTPVERYAQTLDTIASIRRWCPGARIVLVEGSGLSAEERAGFDACCDAVVDVSARHETVKNCITSGKKGLGDSWLLLCGLEYLRESGWQSAAIFKVSGRYRLNSAFARERISEEIPTFRRVSDAGCCTFCFAVPGHMLSAYIQIMRETVAMYCGSGNPSLEDYLPWQFTQIKEVACMGAEGQIAVDTSFTVYKL